MEGISMKVILLITAAIFLPAAGTIYLMVPPSPSRVWLYLGIFVFSLLIALLLRAFGSRNPAPQQY